MLKEHFAFFRKLEMLADGLIAAAVFYWAYPYSGYTPILPGFLVIWIGLLYYQGLYESFRIKAYADILLTIWSAAFIGVGLSAALAYLLNVQDLNRVYMLYMFFGAAALTSIEKMAVMLFFRQIRKKGMNFRNVLVVGTGPRARQFLDLINEHDEWGLQVVGLIDEDESLRRQYIGNHPVLGTLNDVPEVVHNNVVDEIVFIVPSSWLPRVQETAAFCELEGIRVHNAVDLFDLKFAKAKQTDLDGFMLLTFERAPAKVWHLFLKYVFDVLFSAALLLTLSPLFLILTIAIKATSAGPVFYRQERCGLHGRRFTLYKFRTMVEDAETQLPKLLKNNTMQGPVFKMENDPRITSLGKWLRKFSLDELPQLWNVLKRDMSIVGPRPPLPDEVRKYDSWQRRRLSMRPGITCLWQVQGRNKITDFNEWARLDLQYIDDWSILSDLKILAQTVPAVLFGIGAK